MKNKTNTDTSHKYNAVLLYSGKTQSSEQKLRARGHGEKNN